MDANTRAAVPLSTEQREQELWKLNVALAAFTAEMRDRLVHKLDAGWRGWDDPALAQGIYRRLTVDALRVPLAHGQEVDIANWVLFLWYQRIGRSRSIPAHPPRGVGEGDVGVE